MRLMTETSPEWISAQKAADIIGASRSTVYRSLVNEDERVAAWGAEGVGWRYKPLSRRLRKRRIFQVSRQRAEEIARGKDLAPERTDGPR